MTDVSGPAAPSGVQLRRPEEGRPVRTTVYSSKPSGLRLLFPVEVSGCFGVGDHKITPDKWMEEIRRVKEVGLETSEFRRRQTLQNHTPYVLCWFTSSRQETDRTVGRKEHSVGFGGGGNGIVCYRRNRGAII